MSFREQVTQEIEEARENSSNGSEGSNQREQLEQIDIDPSSTPYVKFTPTTLVSGEFPEDEGNPVILFKNRDELNDLGDDAFDEDGNDFRFTTTRYLGLVMDDVRPETGEEFPETVVLHNPDDSTEYRVFDLSDEQTERVEGVGIKFGDRLYEGEEVDEVPGRSIVVVDRSAAVSVARRLDVDGDEPAGMDEETGEVNGGLIEYAPADVDVPARSRYARPFVELRDDLKGERVGIMVARRADMDDENTGYVGQEGNPNEDDPLLGETDAEPHNNIAEASYAERVADPDSTTRDMYWYSVFDMETGETVEPTTGEPTSYTYLQWRFDSSVGLLPEEDYDFVTTYVDSGLPTDEETIRTNIEQNSDDLSDDPDEERIVELIQSQAE